MIRKLKNWRALVRFIRASRKKGNSEFQILTTGTEIIISDKENKIRLRYD